MANHLEKDKPHKWQTGDLGEYKYEGEVIRALRLVSETSFWINEHGVAGFIDLAEYPMKFLVNTGMQYGYLGYPSAEVDFKKGVFAPYFEVDLEGR